VLARLDRIEGVERSYTDGTGTLLRLSVAASADPDEVASEALVVLGAERAPSRLAGKELDEALARAEWRDAGRVRELSAIEGRTLAVRRALWLGAALAAVCCVVFGGRRVWSAIRAARLKGGQAGGEGGPRT
jgi:hypothetical protein